MLKPRLIINADDYGYNSNVNAAIVTCFEKKLINSTTIMVNMSGFEEALELAEKHNFKNNIGIHINLTEGKPLTDLSGTDLVNERGEFIMKAAFSPRQLFSLHTKNRLKTEIRAQYHKLLSHGLTPTHIDSHQHVHTLPWLAPLFLDLAKETNQSIRILKIANRKNPFKILYDKWFNNQCKKNQLNFSDRFDNVESFRQYLQTAKNLNLTFEVMVHPAYSKNLLVDILHMTTLEDELSQLIANYQNKYAAALA